MDTPNPGELRADREAHLHQLLGGTYEVLQEKESDEIRLDVYVFGIEPESPYLTLVTSGMSDLPMTVPPGLDRFARAELVINLPSPWPGLGTAREGEPADELADEAHYWPIRLLKELARRPHQRGDWLGMGHTISAADLDDHPESFAGTDFTGAVIGPLLTVSPGLARLPTPIGPVFYYAVFPVTPDEFALAAGDPAGPRRLFELFDTHRVGDVVEIGRTSVIATD